MPIMENVKGAIISSNYNKAEFWEDTIKSALMQETPFPLVLLLSDNGSTDHSVSIVESYSQQYPDKVIGYHTPVNLGIAGNYYRCIKYALSLGVTHFLLLDSDDYLCHQDYFAKQVEFLLSHPEYSFSYSITHEIGVEQKLSMDPELKRIPKYDFSDSGITTQRIIANGGPYSSGSVVYVSEKMSGFFEEFATDEAIEQFVIQDLPLQLYSSRFGKIAKCNVDAAAIRVSPGSVSRSMDIEKIERTANACLYARKRFIHLYENDDPELLKKADCLNEVKMLRRIAKSQPKQYLPRLRSVLRKYPNLILKKLVLRSLLVYLRNAPKAREKS